VDACYVHITGIEGDERSRAVIGLHVAFPFCYLVTCIVVIDASRESDEKIKRKKGETVARQRET
jgi:hypothetical protein